MDLKIILTDTNSQDLTTQGSSITTSDSEVLFEVNVDNLATLYGGESDSAIEELMDDTWDEDDINILEDYYNEFIREDSGEQFDRSSYEYISVAYHENEKNYNEKGEEVLIDSSVLGQIEEITYDDYTIETFSDTFGLAPEEVKEQLLDNDSYLSNVLSILNSSDSEGQAINDEALQAFAIFSLQEIYKNLDTTFNNQLASEGIISDFANLIKEKFDISVDRDDVESALSLQKEKIGLLMQSYNGNLTQEDIANQYKEIIKLNSTYDTYLDQLDYISFDTLQQMAFGKVEPNEITINAEPIQYSTEKISFEDAFKYLYGKDFNPDDILEYSQSYQNYLSVQEGVEQIELASNLINQCNTYDEALYYFRQLYGDKADEYMQEYIKTATDISYDTYQSPTQDDWETYGSIMLDQDAYLLQRDDLFKDFFNSQNLPEDQISSLVESATSAESYDDLLTIYNETFGEDTGSILLNKFINEFYSNPTIQENPIYIDNFANINIYANQESNFFVDKFDEELMSLTGKSIEDYQTDYTTSYTKAFTEFDETQTDLETYIKEQQTAVGVAKSAVVTLALIGATYTCGGSLSLLSAVEIGAVAQTAVGRIESGTSEDGTTLQGVANDALSGAAAGLTHYLTTSLWQSIYGKLAGSNTIIQFAGTNTTLQTGTSFSKQVTTQFVTSDIFGGVGFGYVDGIPTLAGYITPQGASVVASMGSASITGGINGGVNYLLTSDDPNVSGLIGATISSAKASAVSGGFMSLLTMGIQQVVSQARISYNPGSKVGADSQQSSVLNQGNLPSANTPDGQELSVPYQGNLPSANTPDTNLLLAVPQIMGLPSASTIAGQSGNGELITSVVDGGETKITTIHDTSEVSGEDIVEPDSQELPVSNQDNSPSVNLLDACPFSIPKNDTERTMQYIKSNLGKKEINISDQVISEVMDATGLRSNPYGTANLLTGIGEQGAINKAYVLSKLINDGYVSKMLLLDSTGEYCISGAFSQIFSNEGSTPFESLIQNAFQSDPEAADTILGLIEKMDDGTCTIQEFDKQLPGIGSKAMAATNELWQSKCQDLEDQYLEQMRKLGCSDEELDEIKKDIEELKDVHYIEDAKAELEERIQTASKMQTILEDENVAKLYKDSKLSINSLESLSAEDDSVIDLFKKYASDETVYDMLGYRNIIDLAKSSLTESERTELIDSMKNDRTLGYYDAKQITTGKSECRELIRQCKEKMKNFGFSEDEIKKVVSDEAIDNIKNVQDIYGLESDIKCYTNLLNKAESILKDGSIAKMCEEGSLDLGVLFAVIGEGDDKTISLFKEYVTDAELYNKLGIANILDLLNFWNGSISDTEMNTIIDLFKNNQVVNYDDAKAIACDSTISGKYHSFISQGIDPKTASILANIDGIGNYDSNQIINLLDSIGTDNAKANSRMSKTIENLLKNNPRLNIEDLANYAKSLDFDEIANVAPDVKDYTPEQRLEFARYQFKNGQKTVFTEEDLTLSYDLTNHLMQNFLDAEKLTDLLADYPATSRNVGSMPNGWLENVSSDNQAQVTEDIYSAISDFQTDKDVDLFSQKMSDILGKNVTVEKLGNGAFGTGYKISMDGADDMCLKIFDQADASCWAQRGGSDVHNIHGQHIEVQSGLFVNQHSDDFVKMYFGKVSPNSSSDGFLVTQFLSDGTTPDANTNTDTTGYEITCADAGGGHNVINGKIIDYGALGIIKDGTIIHG